MWIRTGRELRDWRLAQGWKTQRAALWGGYAIVYWERLESQAKPIPLPLQQRIRELEWRRDHKEPTTPY